MKYISTQQEIRSQFWADHPQLKRHSGWKQNQYPCDTRVAFCSYVEALRRNGDISEQLAERSTL